MSGREWDAATYDRVSSPQVEWARAVLERLPLRGDERVLDAGCGSGRVTRMLIERLPEGHVVAVDSAASMIELARQSLGEAATVIHADLSELRLDEPVDAVFSNAVFHWVLDHERLFERLHAALRPGGRLVAQCGGDGNVEGFLQVANGVAGRQPFAGHFAGWTRPWNFAGPEETTARLQRAGFEQVECALEPWAVQLDEPEAFLRSICLGPHLEQLPEDLRDAFVRQVAERVGTEVDYVRLNIDARRPE